MPQLTEDNRISDVMANSKEWTVGKRKLKYTSVFTAMTYRLTLNEKTVVVLIGELLAKLFLSIAENFKEDFPLEEDDVTSLPSYYKFLNCKITFTHLLSTKFATFIVKHFKK